MECFVGRKLKISERKLKDLERTIVGILNPDSSNTLNVSSWIYSFDIIHDAATSMEPNDNEAIYHILLTVTRRHIKENCYENIAKVYSDADLKNTDCELFFKPYYDEFESFSNKANSLNELYNFFSKHHCKKPSKDIISLQEIDRTFYPPILEVLRAIWREEIHDYFFNQYFMKFLKNSYRQNGFLIFSHRILYTCLSLCIESRECADYFKDCICIPLLKDCHDHYLVRDVFKQSPLVTDADVVMKICNFYLSEKVTIMKYLHWGDPGINRITLFLRKKLAEGRKEAILEYFLENIKTNIFTGEMIQLFEFIADEKASRRTIINALKDYLQNFLEESLEIEYTYVNKAYERFIGNFTKCSNVCELIMHMIVSYREKYPHFTHEIFKKHFSMKESSEIYPNMVSHLVSRCVNNILTDKKYTYHDFIDFIGEKDDKFESKLSKILLCMSDKTVLLSLMYKDMGYRFINSDVVSLEKEKHLCKFLEINMMGVSVHHFFKMTYEFAAFNSVKKEFNRWLKTNYSHVKKFKCYFIGTHIWPFKENICIDSLPEFKEKEEIIKKYLIEKKGSVVLSIHHTLSNGSLKFKVKRKTYTLFCNFIILNILQLFNSRKIMFKKKIMEILQLNGPDCDTYVMLLKNINLIQEFEENEYTAYRINPDFTHKCKKIYLDGNVEHTGHFDFNEDQKRLSENSTTDSLDYLTMLSQSLIMKLMKNNRKMEEADLVESVVAISNKFADMKNLVKEQIKVLQEKEYLTSKGYPEYIEYVE